MPSAFYAGDTLLLSIGLAGFSAAEGWTLTYHLGSDISFSSTADGASHAFSLSADTTAQYPPGDYMATARVSNGTQTFTVWQGRILIYAGESGTATGSDRLPWFFAARDKMQLVLDGKAGRDILNSTIAGQQVSRLTPRDAVEFYNYLSGLCENWLAQQDAANGKTGGNMIKVRFNSP